MASIARLVVNAAIVTAIAAFVGFVLVAVVQVGGIHSTEVSDAELIRAQCRIRLVSPDWVGGDLYLWLQAETWARMGLVFVAWTLFLALTVRNHWSSRRKGKKSWMETTLC